MRHGLSILAMLACLCALDAFSATPVRVLVWDEQQPGQSPAYPNFLGNQIANYLKTQPGFEVTSVKMNDPEQGLNPETLDKTDVLIWWGHLRNRELAKERAADIAQRIKDGKLALIALHSAHWALPFVEAMNERAVENALSEVPETLRAGAKITRIAPPMAVPKPDATLTPWHSITSENGVTQVEVHLPLCVFPSWRADGAPSHMKTLLPEHPIAAGIPASFDISNTEMYNEPFHVPEPDAVIFEETWDKGERFRSGCLWKVGKGRVFYFRPGHETYKVFFEPIPLKIIANAARWLSEKE
jgi:trehalose utilization protein